MYLKSNERLIVPIYRNFTWVHACSLSITLSLYISFIGGSLGPYVLMYLYEWLIVPRYRNFTWVHTCSIYLSIYFNINIRVFYSFRSNSLSTIHSAILSISSCTTVCTDLSVAAELIWYYSIVCIHTNSLQAGSPRAEWEHATIMGVNQSTPT